ncbi:VOC family protein [Desmospora activa]|uniref:Catechol 2,3-dioxygenase-like lactoylglutathione lyase family enzyme n=1 Tax=Desmospora activa DSM 45169 TaxID=1121389 RepID=A0A2T4Z4L2_9BACL|nr:VOC family protein [Desmospora activa]PTM56806.1 catechol 2,3-dioxygenase-like lactoylglutathione lyase family enzyme [Desmospora activa DSM 45169]
MQLVEQHLVVSDLKRSTDFYEKKLGFTLGYDTGNNILFYWLDPEHQSMLGLWQQGSAGNGPDSSGPDTSQIIRQHLAFQLPLPQFHETVQRLKEDGLQITDFFGNETEEGSVHPWMPIVSVYFPDPDGHVLELLSFLPEQPRPDWPAMSYSEWQQRIADKG